jgi:hypothetical protein
MARMPARSASGRLAQESMSIIKSGTFCAGNAEQNAEYSALFSQVSQSSAFMLLPAGLLNR